jgi:hypothetical protein
MSALSTPTHEQLEQKKKEEEEEKTRSSPK